MLLGFMFILILVRARDRLLKLHNFFSKGASVVLQELARRVHGLGPVSLLLVDRARHPFLAFGRDVSEARVLLLHVRMPKLDLVLVVIHRTSVVFYSKLVVISSFGSN